MKRTSWILACLFLLSCAMAPAHRPQSPSPPPNPFAPPLATIHNPPARDYDLQHVAVNLKIDAEKHAFAGEAANTIAPLRDGLTTIILDCGQDLNVEACAIAGRAATFHQEGEKLRIDVGVPLPRSKAITVTVRYHSGVHGSNAPHWNDAVHWIQPTAADPQHVGFWTVGWPQQNHQWLPTWDYPNDLTTSEETVTVPTGWIVVGNGVLIANALNSGGKTRTFHWRLDQPHATYLISLVAGPFDMKTTTWRGVPLMYVVPRGKGDRIDDTFGDTPDILSFYSDLLGVKYPWPKCALDAVYDFRGGMENVSAVTLAAGAVTDRREGYRQADGITSHELAHQWFGDLVTCRDWSHFWLNEGFATFFQALYFEHSRGKNAYEQQVEDNMQRYFRESHRYRRPLVTRLYRDPEALLDAHSYPKGASILHTLRRRLGDRRFFAGLHRYLTKFSHQPVESGDLCRSLTEAAGTDLQPFFDQWVYKPGHPVLDYGWTWDESAHQIVLTVKQIQDTSDGTPIYDLDATVGVIAGGRLRREKIAIRQAEQEIRLAASDKPEAVLLDPDHDFLREIPALHWTDAELTAILKYAPNAVDRQEAMDRMLAVSPPEAAVQAVVEAVRADRERFPAFRSLERLSGLKRADLRPFWREEVTHLSVARRVQAVQALRLLPREAADVQILRDLVNERESYPVIAAAITTLAAWDAAGNQDLFRRAVRMAPGSTEIQQAVREALAKADSVTGK